MMKKVFSAVACVFLCFAITLVPVKSFGGHSGLEYCLECHFALHDGVELEAEACVTCHPMTAEYPQGPGKCNLVKYHGATCLACHTGCEENTSTTTTVPCSDDHFTCYCMQCHFESNIHEGVEPDASACVVCHPQSNPGKCNLVDNHPSWCLNCHTNCVENDTTTTVSPNPTTTTPPTNHIETCLQCHSTDDLHATTSHGSCGICHEGGTGQKGNVEPSACIACHPAGDPDKCGLVDEHGSSCYTCHFECLDVTTTVGPETTTTTAPTDHMGTCITCHDPEDLHEKTGHSSCAVCHDGTPQSGNVEPNACVVCHPTGNAGKCNLVNLHGSSCLTCHFECDGGGDTTTSTPGSTTATNPVCPQEKIYGERSEEVELLRYFRDNVLSTTAEGREIIKLYYQLSPVIVAAMENDEEFKEEVKEIMDQILPIVRTGLE